MEVVKNGQTLEIFEGRTNVTCIRSEVLNKRGIKAVLQALTSVIVNVVVLSIEVGDNSGTSEFCGKMDFSWVMVYL